MTRYQTFCLGVAALTAAMALTVSTAYWPAFLLVLSSASVGDMAAATLFCEESRRRKRAQRLSLLGLGMLVPGMTFNIVLLTVLGLTLVVSVLFASIARDFALLEETATK